MTKDEVIKTIFEELEKSKIEINPIWDSDKDYIVTKDNFEYLFSFHELSFSIAVYLKTGEFESVRIMSMDYFYKDTVMLWITDNRLFVSPTLSSYCVFVLGDDV